MITCLCMIYAAFVVVLFKLKVLKPRPYPIAWLTVGGVIMIGAIIVFWRLDAPMSGRVVTTQYVVQLVPYVKGQVKKVHAQANQRMKQGDLLLEIDSTPYQSTVNQLEAQLAGARDSVKQKQAALEMSQAAITQSKAALANAEAAFSKAEAGLANAQAGVAKAKASDELAKTEEQIALNLRKMDAGAISQLKVAQAVQNRDAADAALRQAQTGVGEAQAGVRQGEAGVNQTRAALVQAEADERQAEFALQVSQSNVPAVQAQLDEANFNLAQCKMYAPGDGYVVDWQVQEGSWVAPIRILAIGTFILTTQTFIAAVFPQNYLMNVRSGDEVELILDPYPGRLFKAKVDTVITATGEGQFAPSENIPEASKIGSQGLLAVKIQLTDSNPPADLPLGAGGTVAIYTDQGKPVHIISKVTIRIKKWLLYVLPS